MDLVKYGNKTEFSFFCFNNSKKPGFEMDQVLVFIIELGHALDALKLHK